MHLANAGIRQRLARVLAAPVVALVRPPRAMLNKAAACTPRAALAQRRVEGLEDLGVQPRNLHLAKDGSDMPVDVDEVATTSSWFHVKNV